jgi:Xaa-Pro aminopeptidase
MRAATLDAFVVTHPPNVRYLTGFNGSAGLVAITQNRCDLVVDFRYAIAARAAIASSRDLESAVNVVVPPESYDETLVTLLRETEAFRIGIEGAYMPVSRFNRLSAALATGIPTPHSTPDPSPILVPTERLVERGRLIKDAGEIGTLKEAGRRLAVAALEVPALVREGRSELEIASDIEAILRRVGIRDDRRVRSQ